MSMRRRIECAPIRAGVLGLGKIAQLKYLPELAANPDYEISALCDRSASLRAAVGARYGVDAKSCFSDLDDLLRDTSLDLLVVLNHDHRGVVARAIERGIPTLVEKPLCWTSADAAKLLALSERRGTPLIPAYMRLHEVLVLRLRELIGERQQPLSVRCRNFAGGVKRWTDILGSIARPSSEEREAARAELDAAWDAFLAERGVLAEPERNIAYRALLQLGIHDFSLVGALFGPVVRVLFAECETPPSLDPTGVVVRAELEAQVRWSFELSPLMDAPWPWMEQIEIVYPDETLALELGNPFLPVSTSRLIRRSTRGSDWCEERWVESLEDPFARQLRSVAAQFRGAPCSNALRPDPLADLQAIERMMQAMNTHHAHREAGASQGGSR